jgi:uncharacterized protein (TIGR03435 family)
MKFLIAVLIGASIVCGQGATAFEVASVKPTPKERLYLLKRECKGDRFSATGMPLSFIIPWSYQLSSNRIQGLPDWVNAREYAYDFEAKAAGPMTDDQCKLMVQSLLADRFKMTVHRETREMRVYALVVSKKGKVHEVSADGDGEGVRINRARFQSLSDAEAPKGMSMERLAGYLGDLPAVGLPVIDKTGLTGIYSFSLTFSVKEGDDRPSIWTAVQEQLGLKLEATKAPLDVLVVDHIEKASAN